MRRLRRWAALLPMACVLVGCGPDVIIDTAPTFVFDAWLHPPDAGVPVNVRFGSDQVFTARLDGCDVPDITRYPWAREDRGVRVAGWPGAPLFQTVPFEAAVASSVPLTFTAGQTFDRFVPRAMCPVCVKGQLISMQDCEAPADAGT